MEVGFVVDSPHLIGDQAAIFIAIQRCIRINMNDWGQLAVIAGTFCYAIAAVYVRLHLRNEEQEGMNPVLRAISSQFLCSLPFILPFVIIIDRPWTIQPSQASLIALCLSAWVISIGAALAYYYMINQVGAATASTTIYLTPINGVFWGAILLSETVTWSILFALVLILSGVMVVNKAAEREVKLVEAA